MKTLPAIILALTAAISLAACSRKPPMRPFTLPEQPAYWPTESWRVSTPEQQGIDSESLIKAIDSVERQKLKIHSLLVIRSGFIVADVAFYPFMQGSKHDIASVTKSFTSTLIGSAIHHGNISSLQQPALAFFPERTVATLDADKRAITLEHLLTMSSGLKCRTWPGEITLFRMMQSPNWVQFMLNLPMTDRPGTRFKYSSGGTHLLSAIIHEATGMTALEFARETVFGPMGITNVTWPTDPQGINNHGWGDLKLDPHDMAKLGLLYLHNGFWDGKQLLPTGWVEAATTSHVRPKGFGLFAGYGYLWWVDSSGIYSGVGRGGQLLIVAPEKNMVVALTAGLAGKRNMTKELEIVKSIILPGAKSAGSLPPNPEAVARLETGIRQATLSRNAVESTPPLPEMAAKISGRTFTLEPNMYGFTSLSLSFQKNDEAIMRLSLSSFEGKMDLELPVGLDNVYRISPGRYGLPAAAKGFWKNKNVFMVDLDEMGNINHWQIRMKFKDEKVNVTMREMTGLPTGKFRGRLQQI
ncbi:serine hydrolase [Candidatus Poribacteria bacterium]|nr:serine hydrolase [Candidatus Poribacteria bacterium]